MLYLSNHCLIFLMINQLHFPLGVRFYLLFFFQDSLDWLFNVFFEVVEQLCHLFSSSRMFVDLLSFLLLTVLFIPSIVTFSLIPLSWVSTIFPSFLCFLFVFLIFSSGGFRCKLFDLAVVMHS